jgi:predicted RNA-binding Zn-ribbon protein involved in translation (DUF1610 family)
MRRMNTGYTQYQATCTECGGTTTRTYAREHSGKCKTCITGVSQERLFKCPDCGEARLTAYQKQHGYHCDTCTRNVETSGGIYGF